MDFIFEYDEFRLDDIYITCQTKECNFGNLLFQLYFKLHSHGRLLLRGSHFVFFLSQIEKDRNKSNSERKRQNADYRSLKPPA